MTWILIGYLFALLYIATHREKLASSDSLRMAWIWFALIPITHFVFDLFRAGNVGSTGDLALVEIWDAGLAWLLLGISLLSLTGVVAPDRLRKTQAGEAPDKFPPTF